MSQKRYMFIVIRSNRVLIKNDEDSISLTSICCSYDNVLSFFFQQEIFKQGGRKKKEGGGKKEKKKRKKKKKRKRKFVSNWERSFPG
jgi:hypothetical protein